MGLLFRLAKAGGFKNLKDVEHHFAHVIPSKNKNFFYCSHSFSESKLKAGDKIYFAYDSYISVKATFSGVFFKDEKREKYQHGIELKDIKIVDTNIKLDSTIVSTNTIYIKSSKMNNEIIRVLKGEAISFEEMNTSFEKEINQALKSSRDSRLQRLKIAPKKAKKVITRTATFKRNPDVVAEVLDQARGKCGGCNNAAPFNKKINGSPYLEVHHIKHLSDDGDDTVENSVALCPNCHRQKHFG